MQLKKHKLTQNPFLFFLPFLILYVAIILIFASRGFISDEGRYLMYARNLTHGFYTRPAPYLDLGNGPGYSLIIVPFVALKLPLIYIKLLNGLFYYLSIIFLFKTLKGIVSFNLAIIISVIWALYPNTFEELPYVLPEVFASSLIPVLLFSLTSAFNKNNPKNRYTYILIGGITFGYLALTKPIFGYVLAFMMFGNILLLINKSSIHLKKSLSVIAIAFIVTLPWLAYTYHMTGKTFYWSSYGGNNLYWMSSPYENEYGDWMPYPFPASIPQENLLPGSLEKVKLQHEKDFNQIFKSKKAQDLYIKNGEICGSPYTGVIQDDTLKNIAVRNIFSHPTKFISNCISNAGRMVFNYPASYTIQKPSTLKRLPVNGTLIVMSAFCLIITLLCWTQIPFSIRFSLFLGFIYFGGSILGSADPRMFTIIVPILLFWIAYIIEKTIKINLKFQNEID